MIKPVDSKVDLTIETNTSNRDGSEFQTGLSWDDDDLDGNTNDNDDQESTSSPSASSGSTPTGQSGSSTSETNTAGGIGTAGEDSRIRMARMVFLALLLAGKNFLARMEFLVD